MKDKRLLLTVGYNSYFNGNTFFILSNNPNNDSNFEPESIETLKSISHLSTATIKKFNNPSISSKTAYLIDSKIDDGTINSGKAQSFSANNTLTSYNNLNNLINQVFS